MTWEIARQAESTLEKALSRHSIPVLVPAATILCQHPEQKQEGILVKEPFLSS